MRNGLFSTVIVFSLIVNLLFVKEIKAEDGVNNAPANVIIIVADQMRRSSMSFWQQPDFIEKLNGNADFVYTPNLDLLANNGVVFTDAIANYPLCSPFRGMLLSGRYPNNNGVDNNTRTDRPSVGLRTDISTLPQILNHEGYNTALVGKGHWHNNLPLFDDTGRYVGKSDAPGGHFIKGTRFDTFIPEGPSRLGIEYWYQTIGHNHNNPTVYTNDLTISGQPEGTPYYPKQYSAVDQANVIIDYIDNTHKQRDLKKPFAMLWMMDPPHSPYLSVKDTDAQIYKQYYQDVSITEVLNRPNVNLDIAKNAAKIHFSMVTLIDREIGRVMTKLKQNGLADNTLIVFTADHGEMMGSHSKMAKNEFYEESLGIPLIFYFPAKLANRTTDLLISVPDFMPTILGLLNVPSTTFEDIDGTSYSDYLLSKRARYDLPMSSLYYGKNSELGVRTHQYTYILNGQGEQLALFDNLQDPYQLNSLDMDDLPAADALFLKQQLGGWLASINHPWHELNKYPNSIYYPKR
ncbi:sulfatase [Pseudomonadota bacterium]